MSSDKVGKRKCLVAEAGAKLNDSSAFKCRSAMRGEEASEFHVRTANSFKKTKNWTLAGDSFAKAAELQLNKKRLHDAGNYYVEASKCYKKENAEEALKCLSKAITIYTDMGRFGVVAKLHQSAAELYENLQDPFNCILQCEMAADLFRGEGSKSSSNKCLLKVAKYSALEGDFEKAVEIYENVAEDAVGNSLLKYCAIDLFLRAAICHLCVDVSRVNDVLLERYEEMNPAFEGSRERTLVGNMALKATERDLDGFNQVIRSYESISALGIWYKEMFSKIRKNIPAYPDLR